MNHQQTPEEYYYQQRSMRASGLIQAIWASGLAPKEQAFTSQWIEDMFDFSIKVIEKYVKAEPYQSPEIATPKPLSSFTPEPQASKQDAALSSRDLPLKDKIASIAVITEKEYKPKKFRYGIKDTDGVWYSSFFKNHYQTAEEGKNKGRQVRILYEIGEWNGKEQRTIQSIDLL